MVIGGERNHARLRDRGARASTEPPMVIGGEPARPSLCRRRTRCFNGAADGDRRREEPIPNYGDVMTVASTEPPMVIGGETDEGERRGGPEPGASTEPPMVIGGEGAPTSARRRHRIGFNGAADGDRRRGREDEPEARQGLRASTEPPMVIGGEFAYVFPERDVRELQRSRRW